MTTLRTPQKPDTFPGSLPEWLVYEALLRLGKRPNEDFTYQSAFEGGRMTRGGQILDFEFTDPPDLAINVQGVYYHYGLGSDTLTRDRLAKEALAAQGVTLILIDEDDCMRDAMFYVREALAYRDHSRGARGL